MRPATKTSTRLGLFGVLGLLAFALLGSFASTAQAQTYNGGAVLRASLTDPCAGSTVAITGTGFPANATVAITAGGANAGTTASNGSGAIAFSQAVPSNA